MEKLCFSGRLGIELEAQCRIGPFTGEYSWDGSPHNFDEIVRSISGDA
jgi:hypothetical protein